MITPQHKSIFFSKKEEKIDLVASDLRSAVVYDRHELRVGGRGFEGAQHRHGVDLGEVVEVPLVEHRSGHSLNSILLTFQNQGSM